MSKRFGRNSKRKLWEECKKQMAFGEEHHSTVCRKLVYDLSEAERKLHEAKSQLKVFTRNYFTKPITDIRVNPMDKTTVVNVSIPSYRVQIPDFVTKGSIDYSSNIENMIHRQIMGASIAIRESIEKAVEHAQ